MMEQYQKPPTFEITDQTKLADWKNWQKSYRSYANACNLVGKSHDYQLSHFKSLLGERALEIYTSFSIVDTTDVESVFGKFDELFKPKVNTTRERYKLYKLSQKSEQRFDDFLSDVTSLVNRCGFKSMQDEIILYKIVGGIVNDDVREALLAEDNLQYEKAIQICRASPDKPGIQRLDEDEQKEQRDPVNKSKDIKCREKRKLRMRPKRCEPKGDSKNVKTRVEGGSPSKRGNMPNAADNVGNQGSAISKDGVTAAQRALSAIEDEVEKSASFDERSGHRNKNDKVAPSVEKAGLTDDRSTENVSTAVAVVGGQPADIAQEPADIDQEPDSLETRSIDGDSDWRPDDHDLQDDAPETVASSGENLISTPGDGGKPKGNLSCEECGRVFRRKMNLRKHSLIHVGEKTPWITGDEAVGDLDGIEVKTATKTESTRVTTVEVFHCEVCGKVFSRKRHLTRHRLIHTRGKIIVPRKPAKVHEEKSTSFPCNVCNRVYRSKNNLRTHSLLHVEAKVFACFYCQAKFAVKRYIHRHMMKKHPAEIGFVPTMYMCDKCNYKTKELKNMKRHKFIHSDVKPLSCELCQYQCIVKSQMISHMARHNGEKPFHCRKCDFRSTSESALAVHMKLKHEDEKRFSCNVCGHSFKLKTALRSHSYTHTGERPFACKVCDKKFRQVTHLQSHMRTHTGEKPYVCHICGHPWALPGNLKAHLKTHNKPSDPSQNSPSRKRKRKPKPVQEVAPAPAAIPQWSEQISTINPVECFPGLEPYPASYLGTRPAESDCQYYQQRPTQWANSQNVSNVMPVIASDEFQ